MTKAAAIVMMVIVSACSSAPERDPVPRELTTKAAIPVAFPPIVILVESEGRWFDEMHVDGGTGAQVFIYPAEANWSKIMEKLQVQGQPRVFVIRNAFLDPDYQGIKRSIIPIASRSISNLIRTQGVGDLYQIYGLCERAGNNFNLAYIPRPT